MVVRRVAWESWSLVRPVFSEPNRRAIRGSCADGESWGSSPALCRRIETWGTRIGGSVEGGEEEGGGVLEGEDGVLELALADGGGGDDEGAVGDGGGEVVVAAGAGHDVLCGDGGLGFELGGFEGGGEVVYDAEVGEAEVLHGAGGGSDVGGVACADEDDGEAGAGGGGEHKTEDRG